MLYNIENFWTGMCPLHTPVLIFRRYVLVGLVPTEMEVGVKYRVTQKNGHHLNLNNIWNN